MSERVDHPPQVREVIDELMRKKDATDNRTTEQAIAATLGNHEIVRCIDCEYVSIDEFGIGWCDENCREVKPWDFCAWGERKAVGE